MRKVLFIIQLIFLSIGHSQNYDNYIKLQSRGEIPDDFIDLASENFSKDKNSIDKNAKKKKSKENFYLESNFQTKALLLSGHILFNDPISKYLDKILDHIKASNPTIDFNNIKFYTHKSTIINAFTSHNGLIFINIGLVAKLNSEDEIAFVMCHEIAHFLEKHSMQRYVYNETVDEKKFTRKESNIQDRLFEKSNYSKNNELLADSIGYEIYSNTKYKKEFAIHALENLKSNDLPFGSRLDISKEMNHNFLDTNIQKYILPLSQFVGKHTIDNVSNSTHPDINTRIDLLSKLDTVAVNTKIGTKNSIQMIAKFELCHLFLAKDQYIEALYCAYALKETVKTSIYLDKIISKALYGLCEFRNYTAENIDFKVNRNYSSPILQQVNHCFTVIPLDELLNFTINTLWESAKKVELSYSMKLRLKKLLVLFKKHCRDEACKSKHKLGSILANDSLFKNSQIEYGNYARTPDNKMIIFSPQYEKLNFNNKQPVKYLASENILEKYHSIIRKNTKLLKIENTLLSNSTVSKDQVGYYNDIATIQLFLIEKYSAVPNSISSMHESIAKIVKKYGTSSLTLMGVMSVQIKKSTASKAAILLWTAIAYPTFPLGLWYSFKPKFTTLNYTIQLNLVTEKIVYQNTHEIKMSGGKGPITAPMYRDLSQIINKKNE